MKFDYFKIALPRRSGFFGHSILRPIIPIGIAINQKHLSYAALIDSGADLCIFDAELAEYLGIDVPSGRKEFFGGVQNASPSECYIHDITLTVGGWDFQTAVGFSYDIANDGYGILGQRGFFDLFSVKFDYQKEEVELKQK